MVKAHCAMDQPVVNLGLRKYSGCYINKNRTNAKLQEFQQSYQRKKLNSAPKIYIIKKKTEFETGLNVVQLTLIKYLETVNSRTSSEDWFPCFQIIATTAAVAAQPVPRPLQNTVLFIFDKLN